MQQRRRGYVVRARWGAYNGSGEKGVGYLTNGGAVSKTLRGAHVFASEADAWGYAATGGHIGSDEEGDFCWVSPSPMGTGEPDGLFTDAERCSICGAVRGTPHVEREHRMNFTVCECGDARCMVCGQRLRDLFEQSRKVSG